MSVILSELRRCRQRLFFPMLEVTAVRFKAVNLGGRKPGSGRRHRFNSPSDSAPCSQFEVVRDRQWRMVRELLALVDRFAPVTRAAGAYVPAPEAIAQIAADRTAVRARGPAPRTAAAVVGMRVHAGRRCPPWARGAASMRASFRPRPVVPWRDRWPPQSRSPGRPGSHLHARACG